MTPVRVKICGITSQADLEMTVEAGADAIGFVVDVPKSSRNLSIKQADRLINSTPVFVDSVAVIVPRSLSHLKRLFQELNPSLFQIHGQKHLYKQVREGNLDTRVIGAIQAKPGISPREVSESTRLFPAVLVDSHVPGRHGGTGKVHDWRISRRIRKLLHPKRMILAGGLTSDNVKEAVKTVKPYAVDVSTGVEAQPGVKDDKKVNSFIRNAKEI